MTSFTRVDCFCKRERQVAKVGCPGVGNGCGNDRGRRQGQDAGAGVWSALTCQRFSPVATCRGRRTNVVCLNTDSKPSKTKALTGQRTPKDQDDSSPHSITLVHKQI